jgi:hypothetical protein
MIQINAPPDKKQKVLKATVGIDSIHILIQMNKADLKRFCIDRGCVYKSKHNIKYQRKWFLFLADGEPVTATYHFRSRTMKFQIGKIMHYYSIKQAPHTFIQELLSYFVDRKVSIGRLDVAVDINMKRDDLIVKNLSKLVSSKRVSSSTYDNATGHTFIAYDKSAELKIFSTDLTRLELRLTSQISNWNVKDFLENKQSFVKLAKRVNEYFREKVEIYSNDRLTRYLLNLDMNSVLGDFVAFAHGDNYKYKDHFCVKARVLKRDDFFRWMKTEKLTPKKINRFVKGRRAAICEELGLDTKTFKKAVEFYQSIPNFKF